MFDDRDYSCDGRPPSDPSILVLTCVDGALRDASSGSCAPARGAIAALTSNSVPVILVSHHAPRALQTLQVELGLREPFIAEHGRSLHIPRGYFLRLSISSIAGDWEVIEFSPPSIERAVEMLMWLYRVSGDSPLLIGIGVSWSDRLLLRQVDVPVVVRNPALDQSELRLQFPGAYLTASSGVSGLCEAVLGISQADGGSPGESADA